MNCLICGKNVICEGPKGRSYVRKGRAYCSTECMKKYCSHRSSVAMAKTNRKYASERMKKRNPMKRPEVRAKVSCTMKARGHKPIKQGGNGRGPTVPEKLLSDALGWQMQYIFVTKMGMGSGYPNHYKIDIANPTAKIAIEVDGGSHKALKKQAQDRKKEDLLKQRGWRVLRFTNEQVMEHLTACVQKVMSTI